MDVDVEAMLEAPYQENSQESKRQEHRERGGREREDRDYRDRDDYDRHSDRYRSSHRRSSRHRSPSRHSSRRYHRSSRSRERRYSSPEYSRRRRRSTSRHRHRSDNRHRSPSPPPPEADRDRRTVFVTQLAARLTSRDLEEFFSQAGRVREGTVIMDKSTRKSKGVGYVEFYDESSVQNALDLSGHKLLGIPILVALSDAEKNRYALQQFHYQQHSRKRSSSDKSEPGYNRLYVGSIHFTLTEDDIRQIFEPFGPLDFVTLHKDPSTGRSKGFGFVQFKHSSDAKEALEKMNGFELAGRSIKVGFVANSKGVVLNSNISFNLDDEETEGVVMNSLSRAELMSKLASRKISSEQQSVTPISYTNPSKPFIPVVLTRFVMLNNMFNPAEETEPDWVKELETDIKLECERYGKVEHIKINSHSMGEVFVKFDNTNSAEKAIKALHGRWFGGKQITAAHVSEAIYKANAF